MSTVSDYRNVDWRELADEFVGLADLVVCDPVYDNPDLGWVSAAAACLRPGGALWAFSDVSGVAPLKIELDAHLKFQNWCIWPNDWGGRSRTRFGQKHDDLLYYTKPGAAHTFNADAVAVPKQMTAITFNPSRRMTKIPPALWADLAGFSTTSSERVRLDGKCVRWQKPEKLIERIVKASSNPDELVLDFFSGTATVPVVCARLGRRCVAAELDPRVHAVGAARLHAATAALTG